MARKHPTEPPPETTPEIPVEATEAVESMEAASDVVQERTEITETALERMAEPETSLAEAIREGAGDAREAAAGFFPAVGKALHKGVYNTFYYATYGVVFGTLVVGRLIPSNNAMGEGVHDGFEAARKAVEARERAAAAAEAAPLDEGLATA